MSAEFALGHKAVLDQQTESLCKERSRVYARLSAMSSLQSYPSQANFILIRIKQGDANQLCESLKEAGILIKNLAKSKGVLNNCIRVTIGKPEENDAFLDALANNI